MLKWSLLKAHPCLTFSFINISLVVAHSPEIFTIAAVAQVVTYMSIEQAYPCLTSFLFFTMLPLEMAHWFQLFFSNCCCLRDCFLLHSLIISEDLLWYSTQASGSCFELIDYPLNYSLNSKLLNFFLVLFMFNLENCSRELRHLLEQQAALLGGGVFTLYRVAASIYYNRKQHLLQ